MPKIEVEPKLERDLSEFSFDEERFETALQTMGMSDGQLDFLEVNFSNKSPRKKYGCYLRLTNSIIIYPRRINENPHFFTERYPIWRNFRRTGLNSSINFVLAHESKHAVDALEDWCLDLYADELAAAEAMTYYATFGMTGVLIGTLCAAKTIIKEAPTKIGQELMFGDPIEKSAYKFGESQTSVNLFQDIINIKFK